MVYRTYVEKRKGLAHEADALLRELRETLGIRSLTGLRLLNRYDAENITPELFAESVSRVFSEPQLDEVYASLPSGADAVFAVESLPGQFDQRADSAAQCIQMLSRGHRPTIRAAKVYLLYGEIGAEDLAAVQRYVVNPVEARLASLDLPSELALSVKAPEKVETLVSFRELDRSGLEKEAASLGLAMDADDLAFCQNYFREEGRDPTITEIRVIDTYWSDHCRHTTFLTHLDSLTFDDPEIEKTYREFLSDREELGRKKPVTMMEIGTLAARVLKSRGLLRSLDESEEINACTVKIKADVNGEKQDWLLLFKNETHNHPTEIEPFGGAATCIGGAIRDPLSGRAYVYAAMRVTGAADPTLPLSETIPGKLPQRKLVRTAADGYSSFGNQIGLATGMVTEFYHPGFAAKRMEIGAVIGAVPAANVRREVPSPGDVVILLGGRTGRDGIGGATGSSKAHTEKSVETCGAEVQKGNAPEERKLQRLFRNARAVSMIKRCNDFGAGGVSVAVGELADGLDIDLDAVPKKYEGLDGTELAISESQERMAVVVSPSDVSSFTALAAKENLEATVIATVTDTGRMRMFWKGGAVVDLSRGFLSSNGAEKHVDVRVPAAKGEKKREFSGFTASYRALLSDLNVCSTRGLSERFDSTIGAGTVLMPFGGKCQRTPIQAMAHLLPVENGKTETCSMMSFGYQPSLSEKDPYSGARIAVAESICKLVASGGEFAPDRVWLTFQEYFAKPGRDPSRWGMPCAALLGAYRAQKEFGVAAIGGKDSMSGSFEKLDVPPTLVSFAVTYGKAGEVITPEFKEGGHPVMIVLPERDKNGVPETESLLTSFALISPAMRAGKIFSAYAVGYGGVAEAVYKMCIGNRLGFTFSSELSPETLFSPAPGAFVIETDAESQAALASFDNVITLGRTTVSPLLLYPGRSDRPGEGLTLDELDEIYESRLEEIFPTLESLPVEEIAPLPAREAPARSASCPAVCLSAPKVLIPVFPGTNCEYDTSRAFSAAGADPEVFVIRNITPESVAESTSLFAEKMRDAQIVFLPGGFSGGDEPDGSGKLITAFFRSPEVSEQVASLLEKRGGLMGGICNGFQALVKLGLVPFGRIVETDRNSPTLTFNTIARHQSRLVRVRVEANDSPWFSLCRPGEVFTVPVSHGEGRFLAGEAALAELAKNGQIATRYVDESGEPTMDIRFNPNGSVAAVEGILSPDGRVFGKMGHSERIREFLYKNVPGRTDMRLFASAVNWLKGQ